MVAEHKCPHCGKPVPATALGGICPECMLKAGAAETGELGPDGTVVARASRPAPSIAELAPHFPQLEILECLGRGGMGAVYKARQPRLDRLVALKILTRRQEHGITDAEFAERFQREARALARMNHPAIVAVYDFGVVEKASSSAATVTGTVAETVAGATPAPLPLHYLLMEYVDGVTLRHLLQTRKLTPEQALAVVPKICEALQFAHEHGIVHRDIKPENILLDQSGRVKIADFGIAKIVGGAERAALTGAKDVLGTPHYMAPEQVEQPARVDHRADIFSLGVVFYEMLTGELPLGKFAPPSRKVRVDVRLDEVVLHALEKEPDRRYQHASEVKTDVEKITSAQQVRSEPAVPAVAEQARRMIRGPAIGLLVTGILNWILIPLAIVLIWWVLPLEWKTGELQIPGHLVTGLCIGSLVLCSFMIYAALKMMRLESRGAALAASLAAILVTPGNIIGLPLGIWSLATLARAEVRTAFRNEPGVGRGFLTGAAFVALGVLAAFLFQIGTRLQGPLRTAAPVAQTQGSLAALSETDRRRAIALFNDIEDFGHEFDAAFNSKNLPAAQTGTRRLLNLLTNFNAATKGTDLQFPAALVDDVVKVSRALDAGEWEKARQLARHNEDYARTFRHISDRMVELAREQDFTAPAAPKTATPESVPPVVIETIPVAGAADVDPALTELRVTFSKDMLTNRMWAVCRVSAEHFPERTGPIHFVDRRTCVVPVQLQPGRTYALWFNLGRYNTFRDTDNQPAVPYPLFFQTRQPAQPTGKEPK